MKKLVISAFVLAAMGSSAMAGEQLTSAQLDQVTAARGSQFAVALARQANFNNTFQGASAFSSASGGCVLASCGNGRRGHGNNGNAFSSAWAGNDNVTVQSNSNAAVNID